MTSSYARKSASKSLLRTTEQKIFIHRNDRCLKRKQSNITIKYLNFPTWQHFFFFFFTKWRIGIWLLNQWDLWKGKKMVVWLLASFWTSILVDLGCLWSISAAIMWSPVTVSLLILSTSPPHHYHQIKSNSRFYFFDITLILRACWIFILWFLISFVAWI